jgi:hypothetical protein
MNNSPDEYCGGCNEEYRSYRGLGVESYSEGTAMNCVTATLFFTGPNHIVVLSVAVETLATASGPLSAGASTFSHRERRRFLLERE